MYNELFKHKRSESDYFNTLVNDDFILTIGEKLSFEFI